ncbi:MAG: hypothetical protein ABW321_26825 [Polyangiales bacterium]
MQTRISAVQHALTVLLAAALLIALIVRPAPQNGRLHHALHELQTFQAHFDRVKVERSLLDYALAQGTVPLSAIADVVPGVSVAKDAPPLAPLGTLRLATLADVRQFAKPTSTLPIGVADVRTLGPALAWRLNHTGGVNGAVLKRAELQPAQLDAKDLALEVDVAAVQAERKLASAAVSDATRELASAEQTYETRRKWKLPWKVILKADEVRKQAKASLDAAQHKSSELEARYAQLTKRADETRTALQATPIPAFGLVKLTLERGGSETTFQIPVQVTRRDVPVPILPGGEFPETQAAGLWDEVHALDAEHALAAVSGHFNWHYRYVELSGVKFGGMTVLQLLPCALPLLLVFSVLRMREVASAYNPFGTRVRGAMPRVGFGIRLFDLMVVVVLPLAAAGCAVASLVLVGQWPALPVLTSVVCLVLGVYTFLKLGELQTLMQDVVRSHSNPPPEDDS